MGVDLNRLNQINIQMISTIMQSRGNERMYPEY